MILHFNTMRVNPQTRHFQVISSWDPPSPMTKVYGIFNNKVSLSSSGRWTKPMIRAFTVMGVSWTCPVKYVLKTYPMPTGRFNCHLSSIKMLLCNRGMLWEINNLSKCREWVTMVHLSPVSTSIMQHLHINLSEKEMMEKF